MAGKLARVVPTGMAVVPELNEALFEFQRVTVDWALRRGRSAIFMDCGLGKTIQSLEWAKHVSAYTSKPVLILAPLAVAMQTVREAHRFGYDAVYAREHSTEKPIVVTNYEMLPHFDASAFGGVVADESSILKAFDSKTRGLLVDTFRNTPFRLACTATPAPNDHIELGNHAAFLGVSTREEMMAEYFVNDGSDTAKWKLRGHAVKAFWAWVASWAVAVRKPSDLGFSNDGYNLPGLNMHNHVVDTTTEAVKQSGMLFATPARGLSEQRAVKRATISDRAAEVAKLVASEPNEQWIVWVELNDEGDEITRLIPGAVQIAGSDTVEDKESRILDFVDGRTRVLVTKSSISGFGINLQNCARMVFASLTHSFEAFFQSVRRCHRFGQTREVDAHLVSTPLESEILLSLRRKEADSDRMMSSMVDMMRDTQMGAVRGTRPGTQLAYTKPAISVPAWLKTGTNS